MLGLKGWFKVTIGLWILKSSHCKKGFVTLTIIFFTRVATVDIVLWEDTRIVPRDSQL